jgi:hypothetical protein
MVIVQFETSSFSFLAVAPDVSSVNDALRNAWLIHAKETGAEFSYMATAIKRGDINYLHVDSPVAVFRDGELYVKDPVK